MENNGENLKEIHLSYFCNKSLNLAIAKFCPNLKSLSIIIIFDEIETLKLILNSCQQLKSIGVRNANYYLNGCELLDAVTEYSPKKFYE